MANIAWHTVTITGFSDKQKDQILNFISRDNYENVDFPELRVYLDGWSSQIEGESIVWNFEAAWGTSYKAFRLFSKMPIFENCTISVQVRYEDGDPTKRFSYRNGIDPVAEAKSKLQIIEISSEDKNRLEEHKKDLLKTQKEVENLESVVDENNIDLEELNLFNVCYGILSEKIRVIELMLEGKKVLLSDLDMDSAYGVDPNSGGDSSFYSDFEDELVDEEGNELDEWDTFPLTVDMALRYGSDYVEDEFIPEITDAIESFNKSA